MKPKSNSIIAAALLVRAIAAHAQVTIPGANDSDGAFNPSTNIVIDLSQSVAGVWDADNSANAGKGIYDPDKWAVIFKYSSVNIPTNVTVSFLNNSSRAPVVWLVSGNVTIAGTVDVSGQYGGGFYFAEGGPGGFRGGRSADSSRPWKVNASPGLGFGGGNSESGRFGQFATSYGNSTIVPLIGGSGGGGANNDFGLSSGGGGGGAILIASRGLISIDGKIAANGGSSREGASGSGGAIRLVASAVNGAGLLTATGANVNGGYGRIRIETQSITGTLTATPETSFANPRNPVALWPDTSSPRVRVVSVASVGTPNDPRANLNLPGADVNFQSITAVPIVIETQNLATNSSVSIRIAPAQGAAFAVTAAYTSGTSVLAIWTANAVIPSGFAAIQVRAVGP